MKEKKFSELERELSEVTARIERSEYEELDEMLADYETGKNLIAELEKRLETAKNSIRKANDPN